MPFTPSHAVVALPFVRTPLVPAAIAIGAMTPDIPLFVRGLPAGYGVTHSFAWVPVTVVVAFLLFLLWRCVLRPAVRELSPLWLAARLPCEWDRGAGAALREAVGVAAGTRARRSSRTILLLAASLLVGVLSHIVWDLFTHEGRWGSQVLPVLADEWGPLPGYKWLQHGSSIVGLAIITVWMLNWLIRRRPENPPREAVPAVVRWVWWIALPGALVAAWLGGLIAFGPLDGDFTPAHLAYRVLPPACAAWGLLTVAVCVAVQVRRHGEGAPSAL
ncbi:DUF4184 family protein [Microbacterium timonense]|uniref:DUF4184 family protein n=1 Tax=Microbacterium timonense TaxID=2086576 RepID=UPI000D10268F|nr:DUF4184 family protein [Microbacterium timonense]